MSSKKTERAARVRFPQPYLKTRVPAGRGATEQPNATSDGATLLSPKFWLLLVLTGIGAGLLGDFMMFVLFTVEHFAYRYNSGNFLTAVGKTTALHRIAMLGIAGVVGGIAWYVLNNYTKGQKTEVDDVVWERSGELGAPKSIGTSIIQEVVIGLGASLGREAAPKLLGALSGSLLGKWGKLTPAQRRLLIACGAGSGLAAVYNVPLGGAIFIAEVMMGELSLPIVLPAIACSVIATTVGYLYLPNHATYPGVPNYSFRLSEVLFAIVAGPLIGLFSVGFVRLIGFVSHHRLRGRATLIGPLLSFLILGVIAIKYYQLLGNGKDMAQTVLTNHLNTLTLLAALMLLKPLVTVVSLGGGASGGLFTPALSIGAVLGGFLGGVWTLIVPGSPVGAYAMIGAAAMMGASLQAPLSALVLVFELTQSGLGIVVPMIIATVIATTVSRRIDGYSIYSARLSIDEATTSTQPTDDPPQ
jgi:H+/Cl- antiporter ClcA